MLVAVPHILIADDDPDDLDFFCSGMRRLCPDVCVTTVNDGTELLDYLSQSPTTNLPDCILLDYKMPHLTGPQFLQAVNTQPRYDHIPKIVWSTSRRQNDIDECLKLGAIRFATKPATDAELDNFIYSIKPLFFRSGLMSAQ